MIDVLVVGAGGRMGSLVTKTVDTQDDMRTVALVDPAFGSAATAAAVRRARCRPRRSQAAGGDRVQRAGERVRQHAAPARRRRADTVVGATGLDDEMAGELARSAAEHGVGLLIAPNFALGAVLLMRFARRGGAALRPCRDRRAPPGEQDRRTLRHGAAHRQAHGRGARLRHRARRPRRPVPWSGPGGRTHPQRAASGPGRPPRGALRRRRARCSRCVTTARRWSASWPA